MPGFWVHNPPLMLRNDLLSSFLNFRWGTQLFRMTSATTEGPSVAIASTTCMWIPGSPGSTAPGSRSLLISASGGAQGEDRAFVIHFPEDTIWAVDHLFINRIFSSSFHQLDIENEVNNEMANRMSLFYAEATPMLKTLSNATMHFVSEVSDVEQQSAFCPVAHKSC